jgi:serine/threonine protein kinase
MSILLNSPATSPASPAKWQKYKENAALKTLRAPTSSSAHMPQVSLPLTPLSPNTPRELHDFEKLSMLGKGSTAHVYLTRLRGTDQIFALKMMRKKEMLRRNRVQVAAPPKPSNRCASHAISNKPTLVVACQRVFNEREVLLTECVSKDGACLVPGLLRSPARACRNAKMVGHTLCVDHPFIISYHHCFQTDACLVFVLEYCGGGEFYQSAARSRRPT